MKDSCSPYAIEKIALKNFFPTLFYQNEEFLIPEYIEAIEEKLKKLEAN